MIDATGSCVFDASFAIKLFITEEFSDVALGVFEQFAHTGTGEMAVPDLFYIECANILWKHVRRYGYPAAKAKEDLRLLDEFMLVKYATQSLLVPALDLALNKGITAYDACYAVLAKELAAPLITADKRLARVLANSEYKIIWLGELDVGASDE